MDFDTLQPDDTRIPSLGPSRIPSPLCRPDCHGLYFVTDNDRALVHVDPAYVESVIHAGKQPVSFEVAGPRETIYFDPSKLRCALVTCGGLCPGLNDIIRAIVLELYYHYRVNKIYGIRYGLQGFIPKYGHDLLDLTPQRVTSILDMGGSILGSSRGPQDIDEIVDSIERMNIGLLFMIGGDGTLMAASRIADVIAERGLKISVVGIPKTIDNDIYMVARSFGFDTAVDVATKAIKGAHNEAQGYPNGIGLIKLMGRHSGFIAATAALAQQDVNYVLIPEVDFDPAGCWPVWKDGWSSGVMPSSWWPRGPARSFSPETGSSTTPRATCASTTSACFSRTRFSPTSRRETSRSTSSTSIRAT